MLILPLILFGILQGLTEFLPVSSSGHLSLFQYFSKDMQDNLSLNVAVHIGTLFTILFYYRKEIVGILQGLLKKEKESQKIVLFLMIASVPTGIIGIIMKKNMEWILTSPLVAAMGLIVTGSFLLLSGRMAVSLEPSKAYGLNPKKAFLIGLIQGFAVLPGISRSGSTILCGLFLGLNPKNAAQFSFLVSLPALMGAGLLEFMDSSQPLVYSELLLGALVSFVTGIFAISWMVKLTQSGRLQGFGYYVITLGVCFLILFSMGLGENIF